MKREAEAREHEQLGEVNLRLLRALSMPYGRMLLMSLLFVLFSPICLPLWSSKSQNVANETFPNCRPHTLTSSVVALPSQRYPVELVQTNLEQLNSPCSGLIHAALPLISYAREGSLIQVWGGHRLTITVMCKWGGAPSVFHASVWVRVILSSKGSVDFGIHLDQMSGRPALANFEHTSAAGGTRSRTPPQRRLRPTSSADFSPSSRMPDTTERLMLRLEQDVAMLPLDALVRLQTVVSSQVAVRVQEQRDAQQRRR
eukprot:6480131-Amphidinium_carterae.1